MDSYCCISIAEQVKRALPTTSIAHRWRIWQSLKLSFVKGDKIWWLRFQFDSYRVSSHFVTNKLDWANQSAIFVAKHLLSLMGSISLKRCYRDASRYLTQDLQTSPPQLAGQIDFWRQIPVPPLSPVCMFPSWANHMKRVAAFCSF